jgi:uncharacterized membrane protein
MYIVWALVGLVLLSAAELFGRYFFAAMAGVLLGLMWARQSSLRRELAKLQQRLESLSASAGAKRSKADAAKAASWSPLTIASTSQPVDETVRTEAVVAPELPPVTTRAPPSLPPAISAPAPTIAAAAPHGSGVVELALVRIKRWFTEGNVPVKIGMLVLFAGVAALLKYASDTGLLTLPISLRVSLVALASIAALAFGWRQRDTRRVFALSLQGGAIGVLLITVFAAFRLYHLLPPMAAFVMLVVLVAGIGMLAVLQDALALAVLGLLAGFLAPILVSTGQGSHVALFTYYAVLNVAILGIAWKRSWRVLNLLGFIATFGIGTAWGVLKYRPELFGSTEPFLILNFLFYLAIPLLYLLRAPQDRRRVIDGCLLFGNPLISLLLQAALLRWRGEPLAISALAVAVIYVVVAWGIRRQGGMGLLRDAWAVLAVAFATLAVPLALSASLTGSIFALEGAGLIWLGLRQQRRLSRWGGFILQMFAAIALVIGMSDSSPSTTLAWLDRDVIGSLLLAAGAFASCTFYARLGSDAVLQRIVAVFLYLWGLCWWFGAAGVEIARHIAPRAEVAAFIALFALTAWASAEVARHGWRRELGAVVAFTAPVLFILMLTLFCWNWILQQQPLWDWNAIAAAFSALLGWRTLTSLRTWPFAALLSQLGWWWRWALIAASAIGVSLAGSRWLSDDWRVSLVLAPVCLLCWVTLTRPRWIAPPLPEQLQRLRASLLHSILSVLALAWLAGLFFDGDAAPLGYLPLINPVEVLLMVILMCAARWLGDASMPPGWRRRRPIVLGILVMAFATSATLRAVHQLGGVPWSDALSESSLAQMSLTVVWSVFGLLAWVWGSRRGQRMVWLAGAVTMAVVLAKLLLVDRSHLGNLFGIASFIAYGLLCTVIGYLAPAPPKHSNPSIAEAADAS